MGDSLTRMKLWLYHAGLKEAKLQTFKTWQDTRSEILGSFEEWLKRGDFGLFEKLAETMRRITSPEPVDPLAWYIYYAYGRLRGVKDEKGNWSSIGDFDRSKPLPSAKEIAFAIEQIRKEEGKEPLKDVSVDAVRERALRLGLKLKGRRKRRK
jgi:hypothetical protein